MPLIVTDYRAPSPEPRQCFTNSPDQFGRQLNDASRAGAGDPAERRRGHRRVRIAEVAVSALIVAGAFFLLVGSYGLAKLPDTMRRLHGPTKSATLGIGFLLIASMLIGFAPTSLPGV